jgi:hypothetical protein
MLRIPDDQGVPRATEASARRGALRGYWVAMRPHQWIKNLLIFVPLAAAHGLNDHRALWRCVLALAAFCLCASSGYLFNDVIDLPADRSRAHTATRPLAKGEIGTRGAVALQLALLAAALGLAWRIDAAFFYTLVAYYTLMSAYTLALKHVVVLDVFVLAAGYALRIAAGAAVGGIPVSTWLIALCGSVFMSLALLKRYVELNAIAPPGAAACGESSAPPAPGRAYLAVDAPIVAAQGIASGNVSVLVLALYTNTDLVHRLYTHHRLFWLLCVLLLYWINYMWLMARRGRIPHDPVLFALKDPTSLALVAAMGLTACLAV